MAQAAAGTDDLVVHGDPGRWVCICKASSIEQRWIKSTKAMQLPNGCLVQTSTEVRGELAEALCFVPNLELRSLIGK